MQAIADTCFIVVWSKYSKSHILEEVFNTIYIPVEALQEIKSENVRSFVSKLLTRKGRLYVPIPEVYREAEELVFKVNQLGLGVHIELPESICLVVGKRRGLVVLTENLGAVAIPHILETYELVQVWRSLEIIYEACKREILKQKSSSTFIRLIKEFETETGHKFRRSEVLKYVRRL